MIRRISWGLLACLVGPLCAGCMTTGEVVRGQNPGPSPVPETTGVIYGDRGFETQKNRWINKPRYVEMNQYTGPGGDTEIRYRNMGHMPVSATGGYVDPFAYGVNAANCGPNGCNGGCNNGNCNGGGCNNGNCNGDCNDGCNDGCLDGLCGQYHLGGCGNAIYRYAHEGYPTHVHKFSYYPPKDLVYPPPNVPAAVVQYPYYTVKGPDDFFLN